MTVNFKRSVTLSGVDCITIVAMAMVLFMLMTVAMLDGPASGGNVCTSVCCRSMQMLVCGGGPSSYGMLLVEEPYDNHIGGSGSRVGCMAVK